MMPESERLLAASLLVPPKGWHWKWSPDGEAVEWEDGTTIVMREELALIIERLVPSGVPRIGPLIFLLAACCGKLKVAGQIGGIFGFWSVLNSDPGLVNTLFVTLLKTRRELLVGISAKTSLALLVFADARKLEAREASAVLALLREGLPPSAWPIQPNEAHPQDILLELRDLSAGLGPLNAAQIEHALRTGIPEAPGPADVDLPLGESVLALLRELENDPDFPGLARLVRDVMAAVILPRALPQPDHDSPGGFADIGNRGQLHRLLLSELAHDDDTLAARIALGEALYLRREPAANPPPATLALLLDSGLRMWGTPRVFGTAVALACLAKAPPRQGALAFRASGAQAEPLSLGTRAGLTAHLAALDTALNPAAALEPLAAKLATGGGQPDLIVITHPLALGDADFNAACAARRDASIHAATVDRDGNFALHLRTVGGWQPLAGARLKLGSLFPSKSRTAIPRAPSPLPAMLRRDRCAFLLPIGGKLRATCAVRREDARGGSNPSVPPLPGAASPDLYAVGITDDGSWWEWSNPRSRGASRLASVRLAGSFCDLLFDRTTGCTIAIGHETRGNRLNLIRRCSNTTDAETHVTQLTSPMERPVRVWAHGGHLFLGTAKRIHVVNISSGAVVAEANVLAGMSWLSGRFVARPAEGSRSAVAVTFDGSRVVFEPLNNPWLRIHSARVLHLVERQGNEAIWALDDMGRFRDIQSGTVMFDTHMGALSDIRASRDAQRFWMKNRAGQCKLVDLATRQITHSFPTDTPPDGMAPPYARSSRSKFTHIAAHPSGRVWLRSKREYWVAICLHEGSHTLALDRQPPDARPPNPVAFRPPEKIEGHGCWLSHAEPGGGSRAWLDSRGMLHLQAADLFLPEITIVLAESATLPAWASDDTILGPEYFIGDRQPRPGDAEKIDAHLRAFVASCK